MPIDSPGPKPRPRLLRSSAIDLFCGSGPASVGLRAAGLDIVCAVDSWDRALATHARNHPETEHRCADLSTTNPATLPRADHCHASPPCTGFSLARGKDRPEHELARALAYVPAAYVAQHEPETFTVENVPEMQGWTPADGAGFDWIEWTALLRGIGYALAWRVIDSADCGVPQHRARLIVTGSRIGTAGIRGRADPHRPASDAIDGTDASWSPIDKPGRAGATLARIARARSDGFQDPFLFPYYGSGSGLTGRSLDRPIGSLTTRDRWGLADGDRMRMLSAREQARLMGLPEDFALDPVRKWAVFQIGNAAVPEVIRHAASEIRG